jgi:hypothetical protein
MLTKKELSQLWCDDKLTRESCLEWAKKYPLSDYPLDRFLFVNEEGKKQYIFDRLRLEFYNLEQAMHLLNEADAIIRKIGK